MRMLPIDAAVGKAINFTIADDTQKHQLGSRITYSSSDYLAVANVGNAGGGEVIYVRGAATFATGRLVILDKDMNIADLPVTANTGRALYVTVSSFSAAAPFGWIMSVGVAPVSFSVAATVGPVYGGSAGQATPTAAAGRQILGATTLVAAAGTFTRTVRTVNGQPQLVLLASDVAGIYPGIAVSGSGIPGGATVASIDPDGRTIRLSANATAGAAITATFTHTGFGIVQLDRPFMQGQIT